MNVFAGTMTSSPAPTPTARRASSSASVPLATPTQCAGADELGVLLLERRHGLAADEVAGDEDLGEALLDLLGDLRVLDREVDERDRVHGAASSGTDGQVVVTRGGAGITPPGDRRPRGRAPTTVSCSCSVMGGRAGRIRVLSVSRSVTGEVAVRVPGVGGLAVRRHDPGAGRDARARRARRAARSGCSGYPSSSSTQNDWKFDSPHAGSRTARSPGTSASIAAVAVGQLAPPLHHRVELAELHEADRGLDVGHPVVEADLEVALEHRLPAAVAVGGADVHAVLAQPPGALGELGVARREHPALTGGEELARVERPRGELGRAAGRSARGSVEPAAHAASSTSAMPRSAHSRRSGSTSAGMPPWSTTMTARVRSREHGLDGADAEVAVLRLDVGEDGRGPDVHGAVRGGDERERRARRPRRRAQAQQVQRQVQRGRARRDGDAVLGADALGEPLLELGDPRPLGDPAGARRRPRPPWPPPHRATAS